MEGHWLGTKGPSHFRVNQSGQAKKKKQVKGTYHHIMPYYAFLMPRLSVPIPHAFHPPLPSFPTWLRQRAVSIGSPFSPRLPGLLQHFFLTSCFYLMFGLSPSISLCSLLIFLSLIRFFFLSISIYMSLSLSPSPLLCLGHHAESPSADGPVIANAT